MTTAVVVGSGPNGLAAATVLAKAGVAVTVLEAADHPGGGATSGASPLPGLIQDHCSAVHPMAVGSRFLQSLDLARYGVHWRLPEIDCAHPLDGGDAVALHRSVQATAAGLGADGRRWERLFAHAAAGFPELAQEILGPVPHVPAHPIRLARYGLTALPPATLQSRGFREARTRALFLGVAAHAFTRLDLPLSSAIGTAIITAGHYGGWAVVGGGTGRLTDALLRILDEHGAQVVTGTPVRRFEDLPPHDVVVFDTAPGTVADVLDHRLPPAVRRAYRRFRHGPAAFKVDFAVEGGVPWTADAARRAGTVHLGGSAGEVRIAEAQVARGRMPERPFVLVGQQYLADPVRSNGNVHPVYAYAHVPHGFRGDATGAIIDQFERFAPGFRERIVGTAVRTPTDFARGNANFVGGDILTGANTIPQFAFGPRLTAHPYDTRVPGAYLCSAATPPGPGAHGMSGALAAERAIAWLNRR